MRCLSMYAIAQKIAATPHAAFPSVKKSATWNSRIIEKCLRTCRSFAKEPTLDRKKSSDFHPEVLKLFDGYVHGRLTRRQFLDSIGKYAVGGVTAMALFESLRPNYAWAIQVPKDDPRVTGEYAEYASPKGSG